MIERLSFELPCPGPPAPRRPSVVVGVVASGNLEVLVEPGRREDALRVEVSTSAAGFAAIWEALLRDFAARHPAGGVSLSVNDAGATPAVVALRLGQALEEYLEPAP